MELVIESLIVSTKELSSLIRLFGTIQSLNMEEIGCKHLNENQSLVSFLIIITIPIDKILLDKNTNDCHLNDKNHLRLKEKISLLWQRA
jgi:hypothetical protein